MTNRLEILPAAFNLASPISPHFTTPPPLLRPRLSLISLAISFLIAVSIQSGLYLSLFMQFQMPPQTMVASKCPSVAGNMWAGRRVVGTDVMLKCSPCCVVGRCGGNRSETVWVNACIPLVCGQIEKFIRQF